MVGVGFLIVVIASIIHCWNAANHAARSGVKAIGYYAFGQLTVYVSLFLLIVGFVIVWLTGSFIEAVGAIAAYFLLFPLLFLPLMQRVYKPEPPKSISDSEWEKIAGLRDPPVTSPDENTFWIQLHITIQEARERGEPFVDVNAGELHRRVGGYPAPNHRMPMCCRVMREEMQPGDTVL